MIRRRGYSRLALREQKRYFRQSIVFILLTLVLLFALAFWGIPALVNVAIFLGDIRSSREPLDGERDLPPSPPVLQPVWEATHSPVIRVQGFGEEGSSIVLRINNRDVQETVVETNGEFLFDRVSLDPGENWITARAIKPSGKESQLSPPITILFDNQPPTLSVESPSPEAQYFGTAEKTVLVKGVAAQYAVVFVNGSVAILGSDGRFSHPVSLNVGANVISVIARDKAGNETAQSITVHYAE